MNPVNIARTAGLLLPALTESSGGPARPRVRILGVAANKVAKAAGGAANGPSSGVLGWIDKHAWGLSAASDMADRLAAKSNNLTPQFVHVVSVTAQGGPLSDLRRIWYLVLAAAFGRLRNRVRGIQQTDLDAVWDVTGKACSVTIGYYNNGLVGIGTRVGVGIGTRFGGQESGLSSPLAAIHRGPDQITVGGSWPTWLQASFAAAALGSGDAVRAAGGNLRSTLKLFGDTTGLDPLSPPNQELTTNTTPNSPDQPGTILPPQWLPVYELAGASAVPDPVVKFVQSFNNSRTLFAEAPVGLSTDSQILPWSRVVPAGGSALGVFGSRTTTRTQLPTLPDDGRLITTGFKYDPRVQNPRPPVDGKSRGSLVQLVAAALANPGFLPNTPPAGAVPLGSRGLYVYIPGQGLEDEQLNNGRFSTAVNDVDKDGGESAPAGPAVPPITADGFTIDGYRITVKAPNVRQP